MELSTIIPIPSTSPEREIIFNVVPKKYIKVNVTIIDIGIDIAIISTVLTFHKYIIRIITANKPPCQAVSSTPFIALLTLSALLNNTSYFMSPGKFKLSNLFLIASETATVLAPDSLFIETLTAGVPLTFITSPSSS